MAEKATLRVKRKEVQHDRVLLYGANPDYHVIASPKDEVAEGDLIECEPCGVNFGWFKQVLSHQNSVPEKRSNILLAGGVVAIGVTDSEAKTLTGRQAFVEKYCGNRGWDMMNLTIQQLLEIRKQPEWKNPA